MLHLSGMYNKQGSHIVQELSSTSATRQQYSRLEVLDVNLLAFAQ